MTLWRDSLRSQLIQNQFSYIEKQYQNQPESDGMKGSNLFLKRVKKKEKGREVVKPLRGKSVIFAIRSAGRRRQDGAEANCSPRKRTQASDLRKSGRITGAGKRGS